ncbi:MAG: dTDP-4-keto-6-deoxy-D-glucose epimerase [Pseudonocardiaceae bacterium]|nr:dTDP-4-keto-6-deoxy-D-glucose epimerase [Pseudonocardiaceae bacterium]
MRARELEIDGAFEFTPHIFRDNRGCVTSPFQEAVFIEAVGYPLFPVKQTTCSTSQRGVVRGVHFTAIPPGMAKYAYCPLGRVLDVIVDVRVGSPTFGRWESVILDDQDCRAVYLPVGVGHMFISLRDGTVMNYVLSEAYVPANELALSPFDPDLALPIPSDVDAVLSDRDRNAPTVAGLQEADLLPDYSKCLEVEAAFGGAVPVKDTSRTGAASRSAPFR